MLTRDLRHRALVGVRRSGFRSSTSLSRSSGDDPISLFLKEPYSAVCRRANVPRWPAASLQAATNIHSLRGRQRRLPERTLEVLGKSSWFLRTQDRVRWNSVPHHHAFPHQQTFTGTRRQAPTPPNPTPARGSQPPARAPSGGAGEAQTQAKAHGSKSRTDLRDGLAQGRGSHEATLAGTVQVSKGASSLAAGAQRRSAG
jgi:hypothetical protein